MKKLARCAAWFALGFAAVFVIVGYFAWATSLVQPVNWTSMVSLAFWFGPLGGLVGVIVCAERRRP